MDFDTDSCYNTPAIGIDGTLNPGLAQCEGASPDGCRDQSDLDNNNVYSRKACNNGWCAYMYGYYFEKDKGFDNKCTGHRNDWEHAVVWVKDNTIEYVFASAYSGYETRTCRDVLFYDDTHPMIVYHKLGANTHAMRFGSTHDDQNVENHYHTWFVGVPLLHNPHWAIAVGRGLADRFTAW